MRVTIPLALLSAALTSGFALAQLPSLVPGDIEGRSFASMELTIQHEGIGGMEADKMPLGTEFFSLAKGPQCPHWPAEGSGASYKFEKGLCGLHMTYEGLDRVRVLREETGQTGLHANDIHIVSPLTVPGFVDVHITSLVDALHWDASAEVEIALYQAVVHDFTPGPNGLGETVVTVPVEVGPAGLDIRVTTFVYVDNLTEPTFQGLVDLDVKVMFRVPSAAYVTGGIGCPTTNGLPRIEAMAGSLPAIGSRFDARVSNLPHDPSMMAFGLLGVGLLDPPLSLAPFGKPGCHLYVANAVAVPLRKSDDQAVWSMFIPLNLGLVDAKFHQQAFSFANEGNKLDFVLSNYGEAKVGILPIFLP
jgi:hypothetical protein